MIHQSMSGAAFEAKIKPMVQEYAQQIASEQLSLADAHGVLLRGVQKDMSLFQIAALAKAIACFQCEA